MWKAFYILSLLVFSQCCSSPHPASIHADLGGGVSLELLWIPPGEFMLGSTEQEKQYSIQQGYADPGKLEREGNAVSATHLASGFWMGKYEITLGQWNRFVEQTGYQARIDISNSAWAYNPSLEKWSMVEGVSVQDPGFGFQLSEDHPACIITWKDAMAFCQWMNAGNTVDDVPEGYVFRLPTESEWEYACKGGRDDAIFWWGQEFENGKGRLNLSSPDSVGIDQPHVSWRKKGWRDGFAFASLVGFYGSEGENGFGLADMAGNISEWTMDNYDPEGAHADACLTGGDTRVIKGGSYRSGPNLLRCAGRSEWQEETCCALVGFRVVLAPGIEKSR